MSEEETTQQSEEEKEEQTAPDHVELIAEAKKYRKRAQSAEAELERLRAEAEEKARKEAEKRGEYEQLYTSAKTELEQLQAKVAEYEAATQEALDAETEAIPEDMRDLVPDDLSPAKKLAWIRAARDRGLFGGQQKAAPPDAKAAGEPDGEIRCKADLKTAAEKAAYIKKHGGDVYLKLPATI